MTDGHRTSTIARPRPRDGAETLSPAKSGPERSNLLNDFTTPIERSKQLVPQRRGRLAVGVFATIIALAIGAALFVLPIQSWMRQRAELETRTGELNTLNAANDRLQLEVDRLQTDPGIADAAREEIDYVEAGEQRITMLPTALAPTILPSGWPYDLITTIVALRQAEAVAAITVEPAPVETAPVETAPIESAPVAAGAVDTATVPPDAP